MSVIFYLIYLLCGASDILDGYLARKTDTVTKSGAVLDSIADLILVAVMFIIFIPLLAWAWWQIYWLAAIVLIKCVALAIGFVKYNTLTFLHTYANKATGIILFCFPLFYQLLDLTVTAIIICSIASLAALEELIIIIKSPKLDRDVRGLFLT